MPSVNKPQATLMAMAAHNPAFAKKRGILKYSYLVGIIKKL